MPIPTSPSLRHQNLSSLKTRLAWGFVCFALCLAQDAALAQTEIEREIALADVTGEPTVFTMEFNGPGTYTWWLPEGADEYIVPISGGLSIPSSDTDLIRWLHNGSPWSLLELPLVGLRYEGQTLVVIVPWPHYATLVVEARVGIRFDYPEERGSAEELQLVALLRGDGPLEPAHAFRAWRRSADNLGALSRPRCLADKRNQLPATERLFGAPHFYLWGPALFSRHDVPRTRWIAFARALEDTKPNSFGARMVAAFTPTAQQALRTLSQSEWPENYLILTVAEAIDGALARRDLAPEEARKRRATVIEHNKSALAREFDQYVAKPSTWGDGLSLSLLEALHDSGIKRAVLLVSDLYAESLRPDVAERANELGYLIGPYDSYHSVHAPDALPDDTWETAQFDTNAYEKGRVINADGSGHSGFKGRGFHFAPKVAWPYVQGRVGALREEVAYSAWFVDCDATGESFDDYSLDHPTTRVEDMRLRRQRLAWLESQYGMVIGSEGGSVLFTDVVHFGHGVHTPYIAHLDPALRDRQSPYFLGPHWPSDTPELYFRAVALSPRLKTPFFDPAYRIPLYQCAVGDEIIASHHWNFDSLKFADQKRTRQLLEILYMVPPMYHLNRETWSRRREEILTMLSFWGPLHRELAAAPLTHWESRSNDRLVQRARYESKQGDIAITVNFGPGDHDGLPPYSVSVTGDINLPRCTYQTQP